MGLYTTSRKFEINSPVEPVILLDQFRQKMTPNERMNRMLAAFSPLGHIVGSADGDTVKAKHIYMVHNPLHPTIVLQIEPAGRGSTVRARYETSRFVRGFYTLWLGCFAVGTLFGLLHTPLLTSTFLIMVAAVISALGLMRCLAIYDQDKLEKFVRETVDNSAKLI